MSAQVTTRWAVMLLLPLALQAVNHFKDLNRLEDLELLGLVQKDTGVAEKHLLLGFSSSACEQSVRGLGFPSEYSVLGEHVETGEVMLDRNTELPGVYNISSCNEYVYVPRGGRTREDYDVIKAVDKLQLHNWLFTHLALTMEVINDLPFDVSIKWEDTGRSQAPQDLISIPRGRTSSINTFETHHLRFVSHQPGSEPRQFLRVRVDGSTNTLRLSDFLTEEANQQCLNPQDCGAKTVTTLPNVNNQHGSTDDVQLVEEDMNIWRGRDVENKGRVVRNEVQPKTKPRYTALGFKKTRIPDAVYQVLLNRYHSGEHILEPWPKSDCHTNFFEAPSTMVYLSDAEKADIFSGMMPNLSKWAGGVKLHPTSCYGIRIYHNGSWLREHVDTGDTHIISAIMNVDQDVEEDWLLTFIDHNDNRHFVTLEPGDALYYESASGLHGRPIPLKGKLFANAFVHFKVV
ncbi:hypothetical protein Naga_100081g21 [Nannochloropsis gaditana]|uniref:Uncharacterized protein n=1 Tax=Nannochloropsis gaditana TaxID=72520 RepID=W7TBS5_9STRA|nr:hypothetical protein Naga_100081g21 [Nannochloropsis gaditana]